MELAFIEVMAMLAIDQRELFLEALRPPNGYRFDRGMGTTFTLDLLTLMVAPLSLALLEVSDTPTALHDPVLLLEGLQRNADRLTIFCQTGRIAIPPPGNYLYSFLEKSIVEVQAPRQRGIFHPKVWLLRYVSEEGKAPLYRLLNLSRNLTFDRSWDLVLRLEGYVTPDRKNAYGRNNPLGDFVEHLPKLAPRPVDTRIAEDVALLQEEVRRVAFKAPGPFQEDSLAFYPFGIPGYYYRHSVFDKDRWRVMVLSPFLDDRLLRQITERGERHVLISRAESIAALKPETLARFDPRIYVLDERGMTEAEPDSGTTRDVGESATGARFEPSGLHAKLFIVESGWDASWLLGSGNATNAAFGNRNVEFMVRLQGRRSRIGIDQVLGEEGDEDSLLSLLRTYRPESQAEVDEEERLAETLADGVRDWLIDLRMRLEIDQQDDDQFDMLLHCGDVSNGAPEGDYTAACWPVTLRSEHRIAFDYASPAFLPVFSRLSMLALTPFIAFEIEAQAGRRKHTLRFVLNLPISGIPEGRKDHLFSAIISDQAQFLRYLRFILSEDERRSLDWMDQLKGEQGQAWATGSNDTGVPLLEALVRALSRSPSKIDRIGDLVEGLKRTAQGRQALPEGFESLWDVIVRTRSQMQ